MPYRRGWEYVPPTPEELAVARRDYEDLFLWADETEWTLPSWVCRPWNIREVLRPEEQDLTLPRRTEATPEEYVIAEVDATNSAVWATGRPWARLSHIGDRSARREDRQLQVAYAFYIRHRLALLNEPLPRACGICGMPTPRECIHCGSPLCEEEDMKECPICDGDP